MKKKMCNHVSKEKIDQYENLCHSMIREFFPALALWEACMDYEDLMNQLRYEVFMALRNTFDPELAMTSTIMKRKLDESGNPIVKSYDKKGKPVYEMVPDYAKRRKQIAKKKKDPAAALAAAEKAIVYGRLENYMRRTRFNYHPDQRGGRSISMESMLEGNNSPHKVEFSFEPREADMDSRVLDEKERLLNVMESCGEEYARERFDKLDEETKAAIVSLLEGS